MLFNYYIYLFSHAHTHTHTHARTHARTHAHTHTHTHTHTHKPLMHTNTSMQTCMHTHTLTHPQTQIITPTTEPLNPFLPSPAHSLAGRVESAAPHRQGHWARAAAPWLKWASAWVGRPWSQTTVGRWCPSPSERAQYSPDLSAGSRGYLLGASRPCRPALCTADMSSPGQYGPLGRPAAWPGPVTWQGQA